MLTFYRVVLVVMWVLLLGLVTYGKGPGGESTKKLTAAANDELRVHNVGNLWLSVTNYGVLGSQSGNLRDPCTYKYAPSAEFPAGTGMNYLFQGAIWVAAIKGDSPYAETLVSVGADGWATVNEFYALSNFETRSTRFSGIQHGSCFTPYSQTAVSEQDFIANYQDSCLWDFCFDWFGELPPPLNVSITQKSYTWSQDFAKDFVLFEYIIKNVGAVNLHKLYFGLFIDADAHNPNIDVLGFRDDVSGFLHTAPWFFNPQFEDTLNIAWSADNNGFSSCASCDDVRNGEYSSYFSPTGIAGTRLLYPVSGTKTSFNWWVSNSDATLDWGPWTMSNYAKRGGYFTPLGTPEGDENKYFVMSNGEMDYDQLKAALPILVDSGWLPRPTQVNDYADGYDTRYLQSFGPFELSPGDSLRLTFAYVAGEDFHTQPGAWNDLLGKFSDTNAVKNYYNALDFSDLVFNALWAGWFYDNPGLDTDGDGYKGKLRIFEGDTFYYEGDGGPDFAGPQPPPAPKFRLRNGFNSLMVRWNGKNIENTVDHFSQEKDFEGYRIYLSRTGKPEDLILVDTYDKVDYRMSIFNPDKKRWELKIASMTADSIAKLFQYDNSCCFPDSAGNCLCQDSSVCVEPFPFGFDPEKWDKSNPYHYKGACFPELEISPTVKVRTGDWLAFEPQDFNWGLKDIKVYKELIEAGKLGPEDSLYYEYQVRIRDVRLFEPVLVAVTSFDYGHAQVKVSPQEGEPTDNYLSSWPALGGNWSFWERNRLTDIVFIINHIFDRNRLFIEPGLIGNGQQMEILQGADLNESGQISMEEVIELVNYLFGKE